MAFYNGKEYDNIKCKVLLELYDSNFERRMDKFINENSEIKEIIDIKFSFDYKGSSDWYAAMILYV